MRLASKGCKLTHGVYSTMVGPGSAYYEVVHGTAGGGRGQLLEPITDDSATWLEFQVKWKGQPLTNDEEDWVHEKDLACPKLVRQASVFNSNISTGSPSEYLLEVCLSEDCHEGLFAYAYSQVWVH
jgi:hypothetical protein